uniref:F-box domain-containing protein n=1 Tax=Fagus sylvatica TaxID=28930 RepID=A0A2N9IF62_FAGSY
MANNKNCDRISNLPDSLLCHILSFLETKETLATSTLSTRWKPLWTLVTNLDFVDECEWWSSSDEEHSPNQHQDQTDQWNKCYRFAQIISKVWDLRHANPLKQFRLYWRCRCDPIHVYKWLRATIVCHLEELDLNIYPNLAFNLPTNLFNYCKTLVVLKLGGNIVLNPPSSSSSLGFPSLKILHLHSVNYANHDSFLILLSFCPILQDLSMETNCLCCTSNFDPPIFHNLAFLDFGVGPGEWQQAFLANGATIGKWNVLPLLLQRAPNLEVLVFDMEKRNCSNVSNKKSSASTLEWLFEEVPICLSLHLTAFHIKGYKGSKDELELVKYILEWARVLKTMTVSFCSLNLEKKFRAFQEISMLPKQSTTCKIAFTD